MPINCSEKCIHQTEGICTLNHIINSTGLCENNCPYFDYIKTNTNSMSSPIR